VILSLLLHVPLAIWFAHNTYLLEARPAPDQRLEFTFLSVTPPEGEADEPEEEIEKEEVELSGQIVEIAPPEDQTVPDEADFLAEYNSSVPEEMVDPRTRADREVTAPTYSEEDAYQLEAAVAQRTASASTGASTGSRRFRDGRFSHFPDPSLFDFTDQDGVRQEVLASFDRTYMAGAPSADYLPNLAVSDSTALNAHEFVFAAFWNRVKRLVVFYAGQTLPNARPRVPVTKRLYKMRLKGLIALDGTLVAIEIADPSGIPAFDAAIKEAFALAAPFPEPPEAAADDDGYIHIRNFGFAIPIVVERTRMSGIDPRSNIQFPGLITAPR
jgi:outer membrane biosynthesis protein TonB